jgi:hypothetical protein
VNLRRSLLAAALTLSLTLAAPAGAVPEDDSPGPDPQPTDPEPAPTPTDATPRLVVVKLTELYVGADGDPCPGIESSYDCAAGEFEDPQVVALGAGNAVLDTTTIQAPKPYAPFSDFTHRDLYAGVTYPLFGSLAANEVVFKAPVGTKVSLTMPRLAEIDAWGDDDKISGARLLTVPAVGVENVSYWFVSGGDGWDNMLWRIKVRVTTHPA